MVAGGLRCGAIRKYFDGHVVLDGVDLDVKGGETVALMGRSGSGKSTLLRCLAVLEPEFAGNCTVGQLKYVENGKLQLPRWQIRRRVGLVFQDRNLFPHMRVLRNVSLGVERVSGVTRTHADELARRTLRWLAVDHAMNRFPESLSGGEAGRVALARALVLQPPVLLLDEVTSGLDPESVLAVTKAVRMIRTAYQRPELAILVVTHHLRFAETFADRIVFLDGGRVVEEWPAREFARAVSHPVAVRFVQHAAGDWLDG